jgi:histone H3/H4
MRDLGMDRGRISLVSGRDSDIRPLAFTGDDTENTFVFTVPQREVQEQQGEQFLDGPQQSPNDQLLDRLQESPDRDEDGNSELDEADGLDAEDLDEVEEVDETELPLSSPQPDLEMSLHDTTLQDPETSVLEVQKTVKKKKIKISKHGIQYPSLPAGVVKKLATTYARTSGNSKAKISKDTLDAIMQASDWFFEQVSDDLGAYAAHAGRKTIDESDVVTLMRRYAFFFSRCRSYSNIHLIDSARLMPIRRHSHWLRDTCLENCYKSCEWFLHQNSRSVGSSIELKKRMRVRWIDL